MPQHPDAFAPDAANPVALPSLPFLKRAKTVVAAVPFGDQSRKRAQTGTRGQSVAAALGVMPGDTDMVRAKSIPWPLDLHCALPKSATCNIHRLILRDMARAIGGLT